MNIIERQQIEHECMRLSAAFAFFIDHRRHDEFIALFTEDGKFERPGMNAEGPDGLRKFLEGRPATMVTRHVYGAPFFESVGADEATCVTYFTLFHAEGADDGTAVAKSVAGVGEYHDVYRLTANGWRIQSRRGQPAITVKP